MKDDTTTPATGAADAPFRVVRRCFGFRALPAANRWERLGWRIVAAAMLVCLGFSCVRMVDGDHEDFTGFYRVGECILLHGTLPIDSELKFYPPSVSVAWSLVALLPYRMAAVLWTVLGIGSWIGLLSAVDRYLMASVDRKIRREALVTAGLLTAPLAMDAILIGSFHLLMLWWMMAGLGRIGNRRDWSGSVLLGAAAWVKVLPLIAVGYLAVKRRWKAMCFTLAVAVALNLGLSVMALGLQQAWRSHVRWWRHNAQGTASRLLSDPRRVSQQRINNQSVPAVLRRLFSDFGTQRSSEARVILADLTAGQLRLLYIALTATLLAGLGYACRNFTAGGADGEWEWQTALLVLAMLWFTPVAPSYHPVAAFPALAVIFSRRPYTGTAWLVALGWLAALALHAWNPARAAGHMLWMTLLLGGLLVHIGRGKVHRAASRQGAERAKGRGIPWRPFSDNVRQSAG